MLYKIRIIETLEKEFEIEAKNEKEALEKIQIAYDNEEIILYPENLDHKEMKIVGYKDTFIEEYETLKRAFYDYDTSYILLRYGYFGFESIPRTRFVRIFSRFQRVSISSFRPAVKPKPFDR